MIQVPLSTRAPASSTWDLTAERRENGRLSTELRRASPQHREATRPTGSSRGLSSAVLLGEPAFKFTSASVRGRASRSAPGRPVPLPAGSPDLQKQSWEGRREASSEHVWEEQSRRGNQAERQAQAHPLGSGGRRAVPGTQVSCTDLQTLAALGVWASGDRS